MGRVRLPQNSWDPGAGRAAWLPVFKELMAPQDVSADAGLLAVAQLQRARVYGTFAVVDVIWSWEYTEFRRPEVGLVLRTVIHGLHWKPWHRWSAGLLGNRILLAGDAGHPDLAVALFERALRRLAGAPARPLRFMLGEYLQVRRWGGRRADATLLSPALEALRSWLDLDAELVLVGESDIDAQAIYVPIDADVRNVRAVMEAAAAFEGSDKAFHTWLGARRAQFRSGAIWQEAVGRATEVRRWRLQDARFSSGPVTEDGVEDPTPGSPARHDSANRLKGTVAEWGRSGRESSAHPRRRIAHRAAWQELNASSSGEDAFIRGALLAESQLRRVRREGPWAVAEVLEHWAHALDARPELRSTLDTIRRGLLAGADVGASPGRH